MLFMVYAVWLSVGFCAVGAMSDAARSITEVVSHSDSASPAGISKAAANRGAWSLIVFSSLIAWALSAIIGR